MFLKEVSHAHQGCFYMFKNTVTLLQLILYKYTSNTVQASGSHDPSEMLIMLNYYHLL